MRQSTAGVRRKDQKTNGKKKKEGFKKRRITALSYSGISFQGLRTN